MTPLGTMTSLETLTLDHAGRWHRRADHQPAGPDEHQTVRMFTDLTWPPGRCGTAARAALILTGAGDRAFCAGFDLDEIEVITRMGSGSS